MLINLSSSSHRLLQHIMRYIMRKGATKIIIVVVIIVITIRSIIVIRVADVVLAVAAVGLSVVVVLVVVVVVVISLLSLINTPCIIKCNANSIRLVQSSQMA